MTTADLTRQECPRCGCVGYEVAGGCNGCYCHEVGGPPTLRTPLVWAPCQRCDTKILAGERGFGWNFLCRGCFDEEARAENRLKATCGFACEPDCPRCRGYQVRL